MPLDCTLYNGKFYMYFASIKKKHLVWSLHMVRYSIVIDLMTVQHGFGQSQLLVKADFALNKHSPRNIVAKPLDISSGRRAMRICTKA